MARRNQKRSTSKKTRGLSSGRSKSRSTRKKQSGDIKITFAIYGLVFLNLVLIFSSLDKIFSSKKDVAIQPATLTIDVRNGCGENGLAEEMSKNLRYYNYTITNTANADHFDYEDTFIIDLKGKHPQAVEKLRKDIGVPKEDVLELLEDDANADVRIIIGGDYQSLKIFNALP